MVWLQLAMVLALKAEVSQFPHTPEMMEVTAAIELRKDCPFPASIKPGK